MMKLDAARRIVAAQPEGIDYDRQTYVEYDRETGDWLVAADGTPMEWRVRPDGTAERRFMPVDAREA